MPEAADLERLSAPYFHYWGKAQSSSENENDAPYHCLYVAACWHVNTVD